MALLITIGTAVLVTLIVSFITGGAQRAYAWIQERRRLRLRARQMSSGAAELLEHVRSDEVIAGETNNSGVMFVWGENTSQARYSHDVARLRQLLGELEDAGVARRQGSDWYLTNAGRKEKRRRVEAKSRQARNLTARDNG